MIFFKVFLLTYRLSVTLASIEDIESAQETEVRQSVSYLYHIDIVSQQLKLLQRAASPSIFSESSQSENEAEDLALEVAEDNNEEEEVYSQSVASGLSSPGSKRSEILISFLQVVDRRNNCFSKINY